ncbi:hypothetical protein TNCT_515351 [Trichonephila clavata]|uniref:Uncharacterized protein n=1 Tax=Trichonephila clavata TaxID=2740835 RepID=A0A8X6I1V6_TRICU|nr:hypothetical protein TNCT_515351 [Trichonephila clavata]
MKNFVYIASSHFKSLFKSTGIGVHLDDTWLGKTSTHAPGFMPKTPKNRKLWQKFHGRGSNSDSVIY